MTNVIEILVVDDHPLFREGVVNSLQVMPQFKVVGETSTGQEALALALARCQHAWLERHRHR
jgi:two-component system, NarL family, nitrate/nitrite response regulator NarL